MATLAIDTQNRLASSTCNTLSHRAVAFIAEGQDEGGVMLEIRRDRGKYKGLPAISFYTRRFRRERKGG